MSHSGRTSLMLTVCSRFYILRLFHTANIVFVFLLKAFRLNNNYLIRDCFQCFLHSCSINHNRIRNILLKVSPVDARAIIVVLRDFLTVLNLVFLQGNSTFWLCKYLFNVLSKDTRAITQYITLLIFIANFELVFNNLVF